MNFNEVMENEVIGDATEEIVKAASGSWFGFGVCVGVAFVAGGFTCKYVVEPAIAKFKTWQKEKNEVVDMRDSDENHFGIPNIDNLEVSVGKF